MAVDPTSSAAGATTAGTTAATGRSRLAESYETFMSLLTTQLVNQDPLSPMDSTQFTQQLVQMTGVEQQLLTNDLLEKLVTNTGSGIQTSVSLLGREVRAVGSTAKLANGKAEWSYNLSMASADVKVEVVDQYGKVVYSAKPTENAAGDHSFTWDGKDFAGEQQDNGGKYTLKVTAKDAEGNDVKVTNFVKGVVTGVEQVDGQTLITVNGLQLSWADVTSIALPEEKASNDDGSTKPEEETPPAEEAA